MENMNKNVYHPMVILGDKIVGFSERQNTLRPNYIRFRSIEIRCDGPTMANHKVRISIRWKVFKVRGGGTTLAKNDSPLPLQLIKMLF